MFLCIAKELADSPHLLRCDLESRPMICEDAGSLVFSRGKDGIVYTSYYPGGARQLDLDTMAGGSRLTVNFRDGPPRQSTFDEEETDWRFLYPEARRLLPAGFEIVKGAVCDRRTSSLNSGTCNLEARSHSLYWHIAVSYLDQPDVGVTPDEYEAEMAFWLPFLGKLVADPEPKK